MNLTILSTLIGVVVAASIGSVTVWKIQDANILKLKLEQTNERIGIEHQARLVLDRTLEKLSKAQVQSQIRSVAIVSDRERNSIALGGLRLTSTTTLRATDNNPDACTSKIATYDIAFSQCAQRLVEVADDAGEWVNQAVTLQEGWPK